MPSNTYQTSIGQRDKRTVGGQAWHRLEAPILIKKTGTMETEDHHLVRPSATTPWDAQVVSLIPESVHTLRTKKKAQTTQGVMEQGWTCVCISSRLYLWNSTQNCHCLYHPSLKCARDQPDQVKLSLTVEETSVHVFAIHPIRGFLGVWVVPIAGPKQKRVSLMPKSPQAKVTIDLQEGDVVTCLKAINPQMAIIGTRQSKIYCARVSVRPVLIQVQPWSRSSGSMWSLVFGNSTSKEMPIVDVVVSSNDTFYAVSITGVVEPWSKGGQSGTPVNLASLVANVAPLGLRVVQVSMLDSTMDLIVKVVKEGRRSRIYWFRVSFEDQPTVLQSVFLDRFHDRVTCTGLVTADNGIAYAAFESDGDNTTPVVVVGLMDGEKELDLPNKYVPSVLVLGKDVVTHGCTMVSSEGLMVRARCIQLQQTSPQHKTPHTEAIAATTTLANHLRATFWHAYEHSISAIQLPPSLQSASPEQIDPTVLLTAQRLQQENGSKLAWHLAFIDMTQQCGLYRQLSIPSRWQLLGVGQELAVHHKLVASEPFRQLDTFHVAKKMLSIQQHILDYSPVDIPRWTEGLVKALTVAKSFRDEKSASTYDAFTNPCNVWTHSKELQTVLRNQLDLVHNGKAKKDGLETIVRAALLSFQETRHQDYEAIKQLAIPMIEDDVVAFELSKQHAWYEGLCQLALKHPENSTFDLKPILRENVHEGVRQFVLQWHTDQGKVGHVFRYGEVLPDAEFEDFLAKTPRLEPYRWMQAIKMEKFDAATDLRSSLTAVRRQPRPTHSFPRAWQSSLARFQRNP